MKRKGSQTQRIKDYSAEWRFAQPDDIEAYFVSRVDQKAQSLQRTTFRRHRKSQPLDESPEPAAEPALELELAFGEVIASLPARQGEGIRLRGRGFNDVDIAAHQGVHRHTVRLDRLAAYVTLRRLLGLESFEALHQILEAGQRNSDDGVDE